MTPPLKRRKITSAASAVEEIKFNSDDRQDYLSGFHKRKLQRIKQAKDEAARKERAEKIEARKQIREQRKKDIENHVEQVNALLRKARRLENSEESSSETEEEEEEEEEEEFEGFDSKALPDFSNREEEYVDEDKFTTVTIEAMDLEASEKEDEASDDEGAAGNGKKRIWMNEKPKFTTKKPKKKRKKFRYETKDERKAERMKQRIKKRRLAKARKGSDD